MFLFDSIKRASVNSNALWTCFCKWPISIDTKKYKIRALVLKYNLYTEWVGCKAARVFPVQYSCDLPSHWKVRAQPNKLWKPLQRRHIRCCSPVAHSFMSQRTASNAFNFGLVWKEHFPKIRLAKYLVNCYHFSNKHNYGCTRRPQGGASRTWVTNSTGIVNTVTKACRLLWRNRQETLLMLLNNRGGSR